MTKGSSAIFSPRAATSVATRTRRLPSLKAERVSRRVCCDLSPWMAWAEISRRCRSRVTWSTLCFDYVDSSYVQMLFTYGLIPVVMLVCLYMVQSWTLYRRKNYLLLTCLALVTVNCMFEAFWVRPSYNIFMFLFFATIPAMEFEGEKSEMGEAV